MPTKDREKQRQYVRNHYQNNVQYYKDKAAKTRSEGAATIRSLKDRPCMDCGRSYPYYVMDFDHRAGEIKLGNPSSMLNTHSLKTALAEIAKCDLVCSNCHRIRTYGRRS